MCQDLALCWQNISVYVTVKHKTLLTTKSSRIKLLHNVSGLVKSGTLSAIMGPSGAGKTTLLAAISQRSSGEILGDIHLNGQPVDKELMIKMSGFVPQQDLAVTSLLVKEHLEFMATLKMDRRVSGLQKRRIINGLLQDLGLMHCSRTRLSQLSGGERKRLSLATQLLTDPPILLCDEPTTGLDSCTAAQVVTLLRQLAGKGKAVLCSLHQPASGIFEMCDTVSLLVPGGRLAYFGDVTTAKRYFSMKGLSCPAAYNTAEFVVAQLNTLPDRLADEFPQSTTFTSLHKQIEEVKESSSSNQLVYGIEERFLKFYSVQTPTKATQLRWLIWRSGLEIFRNYQKVFLRLIMYIFTGLLISLPYGGIQLDQEGIQNLQGLNYSVITETVFCQTYAILHTFPAEIPILLREMGSGVYQPAPYYFSKVFLTIPRVVVETILFCCIVSWISGINGGFQEFLLFVMPVIFTAVASSAYGCCISAMFETINSASLLAVPLDFVSYTFSGLFLQLSTVPIYLSWVKYISRFYYGLEAISILQWIKVDDIPCSSREHVPCISTGTGVLYKYGYHPGNLIFDLLSLTAMFFILHGLGYLFLRNRSKKQSTY